MKDKAVIALTSKISIELPCLVLAYHVDENIEEAIPVDVIELKNKSDDKKLVLSKDQQYLIVAKNRKGQQQIIKL